MNTMILSVKGEAAIQLFAALKDRRHVSTKDLMALANGQEWDIELTLEHAELHHGAGVAASLKLCLAFPSRSTPARSASPPPLPPPPASP